MSRITEYTSVSAFDENDVLIKDGENGTKIISVEDAAAEFRRLCGINGDISNITDSLSAFGTNLAGVETTFIATKNYNIGDLFVIDNVLYRATATIASGSEIDPETNCEETSFSTVIEAMNDILAGKADANGTYDNLIAGSAKQLVGTAFTEDDAAYTFRTAGGSADIGDREYDEIVGGSIVWNQHSQTNKAQSTAFTSMNCVIENGVARIWGTVARTVEDGDFKLSNSNIPIPAYHVLFVDTGLTDNVLTCRIQGKMSGKRANNTILKVATTDSAVYDIVIAVSGNIGDEIDITFKPQIFDLTQMFGSEIADYIYSLETATAGAGVAWFRKYFPKDYYEYNPGEIMSVEGLTSHDMVGFNIVSEPAHVGGNWNTDGTYDNNSFNHYVSFGDNKWAVVPGMDYCFSMPNRAYTTSFYIATFDKAGNHIGNKNIGSIANSVYKLVYTMPSDVHYIGLYLYRNISDYPEFTEAEIKDICINLSWDGERDGEYEPYVKHSYPLDSSLTLRGIPKLSTDGKLYYDGDHYKSDGTVERRYGYLVFDGSDDETWQLQSINNYGIANFSLSITDGVTGYNNHCITNRLSPQTSLVLDTQEEGYMLNNGSVLFVRISSTKASDVTGFRNWLSSNNFAIVYELAEPTTEEAQPFQSPQIVDDFGTEEYVTSSIVPVGHITQYDSNLRAKLEMAPNSPDGDGDYLVRQTSGQNEYVPYTDSGRITALEGKIPTPPSTDGAYVLKCTVADGTPTYSWVSA